MDDLLIQRPIPPTPKPKKRKQTTKPDVPYAGATTTRARDEITKVLRRYGCETIGIMDDDEKQKVFLYFKHRGREVQMPASYKGWAQMYLKAHPYTYRMRKSRQNYEQEALEQGRVAVNSALRDWVKSQMTLVECGILSFEAVFMPFMLTKDGRPLIERAADLLPKPEEEKIVALPAR
jgi:hypothetical protein